MFSLMLSELIFTISRMCSRFFFLFNSYSCPTGMGLECM